MNVSIEMLTPSLTVISLGDVRIAFSYETAVAIRTAGEGWTVSENKWSQTTARHLAVFDGNTSEARNLRVPHEEVLQRIADLSAPRTLREALEARGVLRAVRPV